MEIKSKLYPYPVLSYFSHEYKETSSFEVRPFIKIEGYRESVQFTAILENSDLEKLVKDGKAEIILHLECGQTGYRHVLKFSKNSNQLVWRVPNEQVAGRVQTCPFVVAACDINGYTNSEFEDDLAGMTFNLPFGTILAVAKQMDIQVKKRADDLRDLPSIFNIAMNGDDKQQYMQVDCENDFIEVLLPAGDWQKFGRLNSSGRLTGVFSAAIAVPALVHVLEILIKEGVNGRIERSHEPTIWFSCIADTLRTKFNIDIYDQKFDSENSFELAQKLINGPMDKALDELSEA